MKNKFKNKTVSGHIGGRKKIEGGA